MDGAQRELQQTTVSDNFTEFHKVCEGSVFTKSMFNT